MNIQEWQQAIKTKPEKVEKEYKPKGFAYMAIHNPERLSKVAAKGGKVTGNKWYRKSDG